MLKFNDGVKINTSGELRVTWIKGDWYVVGKGMSIPVDSQREGEELIEQLSCKREVRK